MIWASRDDRPAVRGRPGVLAVLMGPPLLTLASVQEGSTVGMLSTTTGHSARAKFRAKGALSRSPRVATSRWMYQKAAKNRPFGTSMPGSGPAGAAGAVAVTAGAGGQPWPGFPALTGSLRPWS